MFKRILVPVDGIELTKRVLAQVEKLALCRNASVTLMTVGGSALDAINMVIDNVQNVQAQNKSGAEEYLSDAVAVMRGKGLNADWVYKEGTPAPEIIAYATDNNIDLIAVPTQGKQETTSPFRSNLGSLVGKIAGHTAANVMLLNTMEI